MSTSGGLRGKGSTLDIHDGASPGSYVEIAQILDVSPPQGTATDIETTYHQTANRAKTFIPGLIDWGAVPLKVLYDPAVGGTHADLWAKFIAGGTHDLRVNIPADTVDPPTAKQRYYFSGYVRNAKVTTQLDGRIEADFEIKVSGPVYKADPA